MVRIGNDGSSAIIAGSGQCCYSGDGGPAAAARLNQPWGLAADASGNLFIADSGNDALRVAMATASTFFIRSVANGASNLVGPIAPGEVVTIYGAGLGPATIATATLPNAPTELAGTRVLVNGTPGAAVVCVGGTGLRHHSVERHGALGAGGRAVRECLDRAFPGVGRVGVTRHLHGPTRPAPDRRGP